MRKLVIALSLLLTTSTCHAAIVREQTSACTADGGTTQTVSMTWVAGRLGVIAALGYLNATSPAIVSVTGSSSGTWTAGVTGSVNNSRRMVIYYKENIAGGADTVTVTWDKNLDGSSKICGAEYSGVATSSSIGVTSAAEGQGATVTPTISLTAPVASSLYFGFEHTLAEPTLVVSGIGTEISDSETFAEVGIQEYIGSGAQNLTWTLGSSRFWSIAGATFKPADDNTSAMMAVMD